MSTAESLPRGVWGDGSPQEQREPGAARVAPRNPARAWLRLFGAELRLVFGRRRNLLLLAVTVVFPVVIGIALRVAAPHPQGGNGPGVAFFNQLAGNGVFLTFIALSTLLILVLPVVVAVVAGDSVAGEAGYGTLRYLLAVPAGRTRLLAVKFAAIVVFGLAATVIVSAVSLAVGAALFPVGPVTLLSGATVPLAEGLLRVLFVTLYVAAAMAALGAIGLAISTLTEHAIGAIADHRDPGRDQRGGGPGAAARGHRALPAHALVAVLRLHPARPGRHVHPAQGAAVVRRLRGPVRFLRLGPLHLGRRHQLSLGRRHQLKCAALSRRRCIPYVIAT